MSPVKVEGDLLVSVVFPLVSEASALALGSVSA